MKTTKVTIIVTTILLSTLILASNPQSEKKEVIIERMVSTLSKDVELTDSQLIVVKKITEEYAVELNEAREMNNSPESFIKMKNARERYEFVLDSLLSPVQKKQYELKKNALKENAFAKMISNKNN